MRNLRLCLDGDSAFNEVNDWALSESALMESSLKEYSVQLQLHIYTTSSCIEGKYVTNRKSILTLPTEKLFFVKKNIRPSKSSLNLLQKWKSIEK